MDQPLGSRYLLHDLLGRGAMGQVYRASVRDTGTPVAVKILKPELVSDPDVVARFFQERSMLTSISDAHVVRVIDLVVEGETIGIVMELVEGQDLRGVLWGRTLPPPASGWPRLRGRPAILRSVADEAEQPHRHGVHVNFVGVLGCGWL